MSDQNNSNGLAAQALLVSLSFKLCRQSRQDKAEEKKVADSNHANRGVAKVSVHYWKETLGSEQSDALFELRQFFNNWRAEHNRLTRPWDGDNLRLLPAKLVPQYLEMKSRFEQEAPAVKQQFLDVVNDWRLTAPERMGELFKPEDFPSLQECAESIGWDTGIIPLPQSEQWRKISIIAPKMAEEMEATTNARIQRAVEEARQETWKDLVAPVQKIIEVCSKDKARIHETLIDKLKDILTLAPSFNLSNDPQMTRFINEAKETFGSLTADDLRGDPAVRKSAAKNAQDLLNRFANLGARKFA